VDQNIASVIMAMDLTCFAEMVKVSALPRPRPRYHAKMVVMKIFAANKTVKEKKLDFVSTINKK